MRTYVSTVRSPASENVGAVDLVYFDTVHADGRIEWSVRGVCEGEPVNERGVWNHGPIVDWAALDLARSRSGWMRVA